MKHLITIIALGFLPYISVAQSNKDLIKTFNEKIPKSLTEHYIPGMSIAIIKNEDVILKKGYGFSDIENKKEVSTKSGFNIGSISKMFTAFGVMKLVEKGKVNLDSPVSNYLTRWKLPASKYNADKVTIRNLLSHTAGISVYGYAGHEVAKELSSLTDCLLGINKPEEKVELIMEPESKWQYSGGGYLILQLLIEEVSGKPFENYMQKTIFKPLKMRSTSFNINKKILKNSAKAYDKNGKEIPLRLFTAKAAAGLHTTVEDLILFAKALFSKNTILSKESIKQLVTPNELSGGNYGMGYMVLNEFKGLTLTGHAGSNEGWYAGFLLDFSSKSGIIVLTNGDSGKNVVIESITNWANWSLKK